MCSPSKSPRWENFFNSPASPNKTNFERILGYIHHVSEVFKTSQGNSLFEFVIQTTDNYQTVTSWLTSNQSLFYEFYSRKKSVSISVKKGQYTDHTLVDKAGVLEVEVNFPWREFDDHTTVFSLLKSYLTIGS